MSTVLVADTGRATGSANARQEFRSRAESQRGAHLVSLQRVSADSRRHLDAIALPGSRFQACGAAEVRIEERERRSAVN